MKIKNLYIPMLATLGLAFASCQYDEPDLFNPKDNGIYFDYEQPEEFQTELNFATHIVKPVDTIGMKLKVKLLGYVSDKERKVMLVGDSVPNFLVPQFDTLPKIITFAPNEYEKEVKIVALRPAIEDTTYAIALKFNPISSDIGEGIEGKEVFNVFVSFKYQKPANWDNSDVKLWYGDWTKEKHIFLAREFFEDDNYADYSSDNLYPAHRFVVDSLRRNPELNFEVPYYYESNYTMVPYFRPDYWTADHDKYIFNFNAIGSYAQTYSFVQLAQAEGLTTRTEREYFTGDIERLKEINNRSVELMQDIYDRLFLESTPPNVYKLMYEAHFLDGIDYNLRQPACWSNQAPETNALISKYYGEYNPEKFKFMVQTLLKETPGETTLYNMFPVMREYDEKKDIYTVYLYEFDDNSGGMKFHGKDLILKFNKIFRTHDTENKYNFPIPTE